MQPIRDENTAEKKLQEGADWDMDSGRFVASEAKRNSSLESEFWHEVKPDAAKSIVSERA